MPQIIASTYEVLRKLGAGGGGNVYLVRHLRLDKQVVLKADKRQVTTSPELLRREVDVLKNLKHPNIPQVYDFFVEDDTVYTVMDYVEGESLDKALQRGEHFSQAQVIQWAIQLLQALAYLHSPTHGDPPKGYLHSDIKPANIMRQPDGSICLIDFNIALALGEENVIGCSAGYASPEHYGLDYSTNSTTSMVARQSRTAQDQATVYAPDSEATVPAGWQDGRPATGGSATAPRVRTVTPDVRSDIYSTGATLYHLLSGERPARNAREVRPLPAGQFSPQVVAIIAKAMQPNPDLRYQSAQEMLDALLHLRQNDPRTRRLKRGRRLCCALGALGLCAGVAMAFVGLKRLQTTESWLKLAEYSRNALQEGDTAAALSYALQAFPQQTDLLTPAYLPQAQDALTDALGVYDLSDHFGAQGAVQLPSAPLYLTLAPDGRTGAALCSQTLVVFDTDTCQALATLPADASALAEVEYLDAGRIAYAGDGGLALYDIPTGQTLWQGQPATGIALSADGGCIAGVYRDESFATVYDTQTGAVVGTVDFGGAKQRVVENDRFANPNDNLLALSADGRYLAASFEDGSLCLFDRTGAHDTVEVLPPGSGYQHFEGGFYGVYFAFSATQADDSVFVVIDTDAMQQTGGYQSPYPFSVKTDADGICLQTENLLVRIDPVTGDQIPLVTTSKSIGAFAVSPEHTVCATPDSFDFYDANALLTTSCEEDYPVDFVAIAGGTALVADRDRPVVRVLRYQDHPEAQRLAYDPAYPHDEIRVSADGKTFMAFSYQAFRIYDAAGQVLCDVTLPDAEQVYDQQFRREADRSYLEVFYYDGRICRYDAADGALFAQLTGDPPDPDLYEEFETDTLRIESPLHGTPTAYDRKTGRKVAELDSDAYLTYITPVGDLMVAQYVTADNRCYGRLLDARCRVLATLPDLCDVVGDTLLFDYPTGDVREATLYDLDALLQLARQRAQDLAA